METMETMINLNNINNADIKRKTWKRRKFILIAVIMTIVITVNISMHVVTINGLNLRNGTTFSVINVTKPLVNSNFSQNDSIEEDNVRNKTLCVYFKQFKLSNAKRVTVCYYNGLRIDIRRFIGSFSTIQGVWLTEAEWFQFVAHFSEIQSAVVNIDKERVK